MHHISIKGPLLLVQDWIIGKLYIEEAGEGWKSPCYGSGDGGWSDCGSRIQIGILQKTINPYEMVKRWTTEKRYKNYKNYKLDKNCMKAQLQAFFFLNEW